MKGLLHIVSLVAVAMYAYFTFAPKPASNTTYKLGDALMAASVVGLLMTGHKSVLLVASLVWLVFNTVTHLNTGSAMWKAYNGFAVAAVLSQVALPFAYGRKSFMV